MNRLRSGLRGAGPLPLPPHAVIVLMAEAPAAALEPSDDELAFDCIKSSDFRSVLADGAVGGVTPGGRIHVALYVERYAIPKRQIFSFDQRSGSVGELRREESRNAVVREMSCDVIMDPNTAQELALLLLRLIGSMNEFSKKEDSVEGTP